MNVVEATGLTKKFGSFTAVDSLDLSIKRGEIFGLLGPNGAGKTTTIAMLSTMLTPSSGTARVNAFDVSTQAQEVRQSIGVVFQDPSLDSRLTAMENMQLHADLYSVPNATAADKIPRLLELVGLQDRANDFVKTYSGGMKRRLELARALIHEPRVLFLDEPTIGLDPQTRLHIWDYVKKTSAKHNIAILLTTHYMEEAESLCDRIAIMDGGKIIALDSPQGLVKKIGTQVIRATADSVENAKKLAEFPRSKNIDIVEKNVVFRVSSDVRMMQELLSYASKKRVRITDLRVENPSLNDVFLYYTGKEIREEAADSRESIKLIGRRMGRS